MLEAIILILVLLLIYWYVYYREKAPTAASTTMPPPSASEVASRALTSAEAPKTDASAESISAGSTTGSMPTGAMITTTTSADVTAPKTVTVTEPKPVASAIASPVVPSAPVTASLPTAPTATASQLSSMLPTYTFHQGMTFGGNDLANTGLTDNVPKLAAWCDANVACKGFTTDAWMKNNIAPQDKWYKWSEVQTKGLYVKK